MSGLFNPGTPLLQIVLRCVVIYLILLIALRLTGKRQLGQFTPFDFTVLLLVANAVQNAMIGPDTSLVGGIIGAAVLLALNYSVGILVTRYGLFQREFQGDPTVLVDNGQLIMANMRRERVDPNDVLMAMREHGVEDLAKVQHAVLETDGTISIVTTDTPVMHTQRRVKRMRRTL
jgi:uncharacterized membrane protein YcaP (DUF421 family)